MTSKQSFPLVSIQGYLGSFHHLAAIQYWSEDVELVERSSFSEVYDDVVSGKANFGLAAIENTIAGVVTESLDQLLLQPVLAIGEITLPVEQNLIVIPGVKIGDLKRVYSHPVALLQCREFFAQHPNIELIATDDTGKSVERMMKRGDKTAGSVASVLAAKLYGAQIEKRGIQTNSANFTRFLVLQSVERQSAVEVAGAKKAILSLHLAHEPGSLARCLTILAAAGCNLTKIESRPILGKPWEYVMYLELTSNHSQAEWQTIIGKLQFVAQLVTELGRFSIK